jgi:5-methylcytosine-specific restriction endonuclease McrA
VENQVHISWEAKQTANVRRSSTKISRRPNTRKVPPLTRKQRYAKFLKSQEWQDQRRKVIARDHGKCTNCGSRKRPQVHHKRYSVWGHEPLEDLELLCRNCHRLAHGL